MRPARYLLIAALSALGLTLLAVVATNGLYRATGADRRMDPSSPASLGFFDSSGLSAAAYNRAALRREGPQVILIGASNMIKVPAGAVERQLHVPVHNMSISGGEPSDFARLADLALEATPAGSRRDLIFVVGVTYAAFTAESREPVRPLDSELLRFGLYARGKDDRMAFRPGTAALPATLDLLRPVLLASRIWQAAAERNGQRIDDRLSGGATAVFERIDLDALDEVSRRPAMIADRLAAQTRPITDESLALLDPMARRVSAAGARLVVVDLPIPSWHAAGVPAFSAYQHHKKVAFDRLQRLPGVYYLDLQQGFPDSGFYDSMHPRPAAVGAWAQRIAEGLATLPGLGLSKPPVEPGP